MWLMLQQDKPDDYIIATGKTNTVRKLVEISGRSMVLKYGGRGMVWMKKVTILLAEKRL